MPNYRAMTRSAARRYGLDPGVFARQIQQESGFNPGAVSPAGARGIAQIMPATARGWGVDPMNPRAALDAAAKNMARYVREYGGYENALRAYNAGPGRIQASKGFAETNNYVKTILGGRSPGKLGPSRGGGGGRVIGRTPTQLSFDAGQDSGTALLAALQVNRERPQVTAPPAPDFAGKPVLPESYRAVETSGAPERPRSMSDALTAIADAGYGQVGTKMIGGQTIRGPRGGGGGGVNLTPRGSYAGTTGLVNSLARLAHRRAGTQVTSGKRDTVTTASGGVSDHYAGNRIANARDIGGTVPQMDKAASVIARALGIEYTRGKPLVANVTRNGVRYQVLYRTNVGGNHFDHVHVGAKRL